MASVIPEVYEFQRQQVFCRFFLLCSGWREVILISQLNDTQINELDLGHLWRALIKMILDKKSCMASSLTYMYTFPGVSALILRGKVIYSVFG